MLVQSIRKIQKHNGHMIKCLLTELRWARQENIWLLVRTHGLRAQYLKSRPALPLSQQVHISVIYYLLYLFHNHFHHMARNTQQSGLQFEGLLTDNPPSPGKVATPPGSTSPTLFEQWCGFFYIPQELDKWKCCEMRPMVFRPYRGKLESLTICRCHSKGSTFSSVILRPWVLVWTGFEPVTSRSADWRSPNWANQVVVKGTHQWTNFPYKSSCIILFTWQKLRMTRLYLHTCVVYYHSFKLDLWVKFGNLLTSFQKQTITLLPIERIENSQMKW